MKNCTTCKHFKGVKPNRYEPEEADVDCEIINENNEAIEFFEALDLEMTGLENAETCKYYEEE